MQLMLSLEIHDLSKIMFPDRKQYFMKCFYQCHP